MKGQIYGGGIRSTRESQLLEPRHEGCLARLIHEGVGRLLKEHSAKEARGTRGGLKLE